MIEPGSPAVRGPLRWVRGAVVGTTAVGIAALGHLLAGGSVDLVSGAVLLALAVGTATALSGRRWRLPSLLTFLLGAQLVLHVGLGGSMAMGTHVDMPGMAGATVTDVHGSSSMGGGMLLAHLFAAAATALALRRGEEWCWSLLDLLRAPWTAPAGPVVVPTSSPATFVPEPLRVVPTLLASVVVRRGPPLLRAS